MPVKLSLPHELSQLGTYIGIGLVDPTPYRIALLAPRGQGCHRLLH